MEKFIAFISDHPKGGYVGIHKSMSLPNSFIISKGDDEHLLDDYLMVYGGIMFDQDHWYKTIPICPLTNIPINYYNDYRIIGFDPGKSLSFEQTATETISLLNQLKNLTNEY